jgi:hypothetical protein
MLSRPADLSDETLGSVLVRHWDLEATSMTYRPVGFGSHHWEISDRDGVRWFVTVDELDIAPSDAAFDRLSASLATAGALHDEGCRFVVAPLPTLDGEPLARAGDRFGVALYPFIDGQSFQWGEFSSPEHRRGVLDRLISVHTAPSAAGRQAIRDDFSIPYRDDLQAAFDIANDVGDCGPYAHATSVLIAGNAEPIQRWLARYDGLVADCRTRPDRAVVTHGEPHPGNTMLTSSGWLLIDWDTVLVAPPERDLWGLDPGDGSILDAYAAATGVRPLATELELYRIRWDLSDLAVGVGRFRRDHVGSEDDDKSWAILRSLIETVSG